MSTEPDRGYVFVVNPLTSIMKTLPKTKKTSPRIKAKNLTLGDSGKNKSARLHVNPSIVSDDRLGSDEPLDEANGSATGVKEVQASDHRVRKIEPEDEHNNENLIEEGLQGHMHGSLTKPRKTT
jgi:hypothetical protein